MGSPEPYNINCTSLTLLHSASSWLSSALKNNKFALSFIYGLVVAARSDFISIKKKQVLDLSANF